MKKMISLNSEGKLILKTLDGKVEDIRHSNSAFVFLVIDCSSSMEGNKLVYAKKGAIEFAKTALVKGYSVGLIRFAEQAELMCEPGYGISTLSNNLERLIASGSTNMTEGIQLSIGKLSAINGLRTIVIVTDGMPDDKKTTLTAAQQAKGMGIDIITIGTDDADKDFLIKLASRADLAVKVSKDFLAQGIASAAKMLPAR